MFSADILSIPVLLFFLTAAALYDALYRKIPNCLILGALGLAGMWLAIFADVGVMILAVLNAIRALKVRHL